MKIRSDPSVCVGAGMCVLNAARMFTQSDEDGTVQLVHDATVPDDLREDVVAAVEACPSRAISIVD